MADAIKVSFVGDTKSLDKALDNVEKSVKDIDKEIDNATRGMGRFSQGFDGVRDGADDTERRIVGFRDSLTGTQDVMKGMRDGDLVALSTGFADLASSVANLGADMLEWGRKAWDAAKQVVEAHGASIAAKARDVAATVAHKAASIAATVATQAQAAAQWLLNAAMDANPIMLVVLGLAALTAAFVVAWKNSETFREIVTGAFDAVKAFAEAAFNWIKDNWPLLLAIITGPIGLAVYVISKHWDEIKAGVTAVKDWIVGAFTDVIAFIIGMPDKITAAAAGMFDGIGDAFKDAINSIIKLWNSLEFPSYTFPKVSTPFGDIGGQTVGGWHLPHIPEFDLGGIVPGMRGSPQLVLAHGGETILPTHRSDLAMPPARVVVPLLLDGRTLAEAQIEVDRRYS